MLSESDINLLKRAYRDRSQIAILADGRKVKRQVQLRWNSCVGCVFAHDYGCFCSGGEIWVLTN